jgi:hypothetical protein
MGMDHGEDFERAWQAKLSAALAEIAGQEIHDVVMAGCEELSSDSGPQAAIDWSAAAMERLDALANGD